MRGDIYEGGCLGSRGTRIWLFLGFVMGFASVIASIWILFADFMKEGKMIMLTFRSDFQCYLSGERMAGVALFLQNALIFISSIIYKFGRSEDLWG